MREVNQVFKDGFAVGLRPTTAIGPDTQYLTHSYNLVPTSAGLIPRENVSQLTEATFSESYPFPALFCCSRHILLFTATDVYRINSDWEPEHLLTKKWGGLPQIADFMDFLVWATPAGAFCLRNGAIVEELHGAQFKTCTNFRGQLVVGNCVLPKGPEKVEHEFVENRVDVQGQNIVAWSKIGSIDWEYSLGNEVGWAPMDWDGEVLGLLPLGKEIIVYGANGLAKMAPATEPTPTFGIQDFGAVGVKNRNCFAGDFTSHLFLGNDNALYVVEPERALSGEGKLPKRLGYEEFLSELQDPIVTFDPVLRQWWIGDAQTCYIFSGTALGESSETPTHLNRLDGNLYGHTFKHGTSSAVVETGPVSFDSRGIKTLMCVESDISSPCFVKGSTSFRYGYGDPWRNTHQIRLDPRGAFFPVTAGTEIRVRFDAPHFEDFHVTKLWLHFKNTDKTFSRGVINAGRPAE